MNKINNKEITFDNVTEKLIGKFNEGVKENSITKQEELEIENNLEQVLQDRESTGDTSYEAEDGLAEAKELILKANQDISLKDGEDFSVLTQST